MTDATIMIKAKDATKKAFSSVSGNLGKLTSSLNSTQARIAGLVGAGGFGAFITMSAKAKLETVAFTNTMNASNQELQAWNYGLEGSGIQGEKLANIWRDSSEKIGEAFSQGTGEAVGVLDRLNLSASEMVRLSPDQKLLAIGEAMKSVKSQDERISLMEQLASDSSQLLPYITENTKEFKAMRAEAKATGAAISDIDTAKLQAANVSLSRSGQILSGVGARIAAGLAPYAEAIANLFAESAAKNNGFKDQIIAGIKYVANGVAFLMDMWRGLEAVWSGLEVAFWGTAYGLLKGIEKLGQGIESVLNLLPGVELEGSKYFANLASSAEKKLEAAGVAFDELVMRPMPSQKVEQFFNDIEAKANAKAAEYVNGNKKPLLQVMTGYSDEKNKQEELAKLQKSQQDKYQAMMEGYAGEMELTYLHEAQKKEFLDQARASNAISEQQYETAHTLISKEGNDARAALAEKERKHKLSVYQGMMGNLTALMASGSKTQFMIGKRAAQVNALLSAKESVVHAYKEGTKVGGPWVGAAYAATAGIATAAQIADLESVSFGGGGSISPSGGGGVSAGAGQAPRVPVPPALTAGQQGGFRGTATYNLIGDENTTFTYNQVQSMMLAMKESISNGDQILIEAGSRQALELMS